MIKYLNFTDVETNYVRNSANTFNFFQTKLCFITNFYFNFMYVLIKAIKALKLCSRLGMLQNVSSI